MREKEKRDMEKWGEEREDEENFPNYFGLATKLQNWEKATSVSQLHVAPLESLKWSKCLLLELILIISNTAFQFVIMCFLFKSPS